jgi:hypothetical protein
VWVTGATAVSALAVGRGRAGPAAALHPGGDATTGPDVSLDDLQSDAEQAHGLAIGADIAFGLAAAATAATVVLAFTLTGEPASTASTARAPAHERRPARSEVRVELVPGRARLVWWF